MRAKALALALVFASGAATAQSDAAAKMDAVAKAYAEKKGFMGSVLVAKSGTVLFEKSYGMADLEWDVPNTPDAKFRLGSITKQFTATAILQLQEKGKLSVDDPITKYVEGAPEAWKGITIHHLLTHTSGIPSYTDSPDFPKPKFMRIPLSPLEIVMLSKDKPLEFQPGEKWKYDNTGYVLLGYIIEKVSGEKYGEYLKKHVFDPLDMKDSGYDWSRTVLKHRASGYQWGGASYLNAEYLDMSLPHAAGSLYSTVRDLYRWDRSLYTEKALSKKSLDRMFTPVKNDYAYGWFVTHGKDRTRITHGGGINGFSTIITRYPEQQAVVIVLSNVENGDPNGVATRLANILFDEPVQLPWDRKEVSVDPKVLDRYPGTYDLGAIKIDVTAEDGKLFIHPTGQPKMQLFAQSENSFFLKVVDATFDFVLGPDGKAKEMITHQGGADKTGPRIK
jgi:CubicO group peptidase (beta-lactamase class C family)